MNELTKAEEQVMQYAWKLEKAFLKDFVEQFPEPKPAYTTISTVVRVLVPKEFSNLTLLVNPSVYPRFQRPLFYRL